MLAKQTTNASAIKWSIDEYQSYHMEECPELVCTYTVKYASTISHKL